MDASFGDLAVFLIATFVSALLTGLSGFAFGLVAASIWLYVLTPQQATSLIVAFGLLVQAYSVWQLRHALDWNKLWPFLAGAAFDAPAGVVLLSWADPVQVRKGVGILLVVYGLYALFRPPLKPVTSGGVAADMGVGFLNGMLAGITGLAGILVTIWCGLRGSKDVQRAVFQPVAVGIFAIAAVTIGIAGAVTPQTIRLFLLGLPLLIAGS